MENFDYIVVGAGSSGSVITSRLSENESNALLAEINSYIDTEKFIYSHVWEPFDLVMWDNRAVLHRATPIKGKIEKRLMVRTTVAGKTSTINEY